MLAAFSASNNLPIAALLESDASRAVLASEVTPASISARSGATDMEASPLTVIIGGGMVCASAGVASNTLAKMVAASGVRCPVNLISAARRR